MSLKQSAIYSSALKEAIDPEPLVVTSEMLVEEVLAMMSQLRSSCRLPGEDDDSLEDLEFLQAIRASCALVLEKPAELSGKASQKSGQISAQKSAQNSGQKSGQISAQKSGQISAQKSGQISAQKSGQISAQKSGQISAQKSGQISAQKSGQISAQKSGQISAQKSGQRSGQISVQRLAPKSGQISAQRSGQAQRSQRLGQRSRSPKLLGIFTERDIVRLAAAGKNLKNLTVAEIMTPRVITLTLSERQDIFTALSVLRQHRIRHLPIMHPDGMLLGIVTPQTIRRALQPANIVTQLRYVKDVMNRNVVCAPAADSVLDLARRMALHKISCVVLTEKSRLEPDLSANVYHLSETANYQNVIPVGIVTERDIVQFQALGLDLGKMRSSDVMSAPLFCLKLEDTLWFAHEEMQRRRVRRLVVVGAAGELLGIVSQSNLLQALEPTEMYGVIELLQRAVEDRTKELKEANQQLEGEVEERRKAEAALQEAHDELQRKVEERTAELQKANRLLKEDIVRRKKVEAALRESEAQSRSQTEQLEKTLHKLHATQIQLVQAEKMSSLGQLVAGIAHEINNPVNFIYGNLAHANQYINEIIDLVELFREHYPEPEEEISQEIQDMDLDFMIVDLAKILNSMRIGADRIRSIVLSLRNFSRLDESEMKEVDIHEGIESTLLILQHRLGEANSENRQIQVIKEYGKLPLVECYPGLLNQVFINILTNALDVLETQLGERAILIHTSIGHGELGTWGIGELGNWGHGELGRWGDGDMGNWGVSGAWEQEDLAENSKLRTQDSKVEAKNSEVEVKNSKNSKLNSQNSKLKTQNTEEFIIIRIADNGPGMGQEVRNRLFEPFFTTKSVGKGTGLGLSISYQIVVEKHGGHIDCISAPGRGTEFRLEIPLRQSAPCRA